MYDNSGGKIKLLATVSAILMIIGCIIGGIALIAASAMDGFFSFLGILVIVVGSLISWISSWVLYGFGELIESITVIKNSITTEKTEKITETVDDELPEL